MAKPSLSKAQNIEIASIKEDTEFYRELILQLSSHKTSSTLIFGLIPYISLYIVETYSYLQRMFPTFASSLSMKYDNVIKSSRMRVKFFDDSKKRIDGMFELLAWVNEFYTEWHINKHKGFLSPLKRILQKDLGVFGFEAHIFGSTHTGLLNIGYVKGDLPTTSKEISATLGSTMHTLSVEMGNYIGQLRRWPEFAPDSLDVKYFDYQIQDELLGYRDEKARVFFASVFNGGETQNLNFTLTLFLVTVNFLRYILKKIFSGAPPTLFKVKFVTLYHLASSLMKLQNYFYPKNVLTDRSKKYFQALLQEENLKLIGRQSDLRNILVHYGVDCVPDENLFPALKLYGLVEYFFDGKTYAEIDCVLDSSLERVSILLEEWLNWDKEPMQFSHW